MARQRLTLPPIFNQRLKKIRGAFPPRSHPCQPLLSFSAHSIRKRRNRFSPAVCSQPTFKRSGAHFRRDHTRVNCPLLSLRRFICKRCDRFFPPFALNQRPERSGTHFRRGHIRANCSFLSLRRFICKRRDRLSPAVCP